MATGNVCLRMPLRVTTKIEPVGIRLVALSFMACSEIWSSESWTSSPDMSFGDTQGILPVQYAGCFFDGVPPPTTLQREPNSLTGKLRLFVVGSPNISLNSAG